MRMNIERMMVGCANELAGKRDDSDSEMEWTVYIFYSPDSLD